MTTEVPEVLLAAQRHRVFSGAAWSIGTAAGPLRRGVLGVRRWDGAPVAEDDLWDLASVTKPVVGLVVMALVERGVLNLADTVGDHLPEYHADPAGRDKAAITVRQLLAHSSGLPGGTPLYREHPTRDALLAAIRARPLAVAPGTRVEYSSQGFILLGLIAERAAGAGLDELVSELVCAPLRLRDTGFGPVDPARAVATEQCRWRGRLVVGEVHDENAVVLGGVAGHAGLFSTLADLEQLGAALVAGGGALLGPETMAEMTRCQTDGLNLRRGLAWQLRDPAGCPVGNRVGPNSYGHTGFTGTSLWIDPDRGRYYVLLTNQVHPTRAGEGIRTVRRQFHAMATADSWSH